MKTNPIGIRFEQDEYDVISDFASKQGMSFSDVVRQASLAYLNSNQVHGRKSLAEIASQSNADMALLFGQFLDDFSHAQDKESLIIDEPIWASSPGRWKYDFAATAHKLAHDNAIPVPKWVLDDDYVAPVPMYAFDTKDSNFQEYLRKTTPKEFRWHNLFLGENILSRA